MNMLQQLDRIGQVPAGMAVEAQGMMDDSAAGWALIRQLDAKFGNPACSVCCEPATVGEHCAGCAAALERIEHHVMALAMMPADFAAAVAELDAGRLDLPSGIDWAQVTDETWG